MSESICWRLLYYGTPLLIVFATGLVAASVRSAIRTHRQRSVAIALASVACLVAAVFANPVFNLLIVAPLFEPRVHRMYDDLSRESYDGRSKAEVVARFGSPDRIVGGADDEVMLYRCCPWFAMAWTEVAVRVRDGKVDGFWLDD